MLELIYLLATCNDGEIRDSKEAIEISRQACELTDWGVGNGAYYCRDAHPAALWRPASERFTYHSLQSGTQASLSVGPTSLADILPTARQMPEERPKWSLSLAVAAKPARSSCHEGNVSMKVVR